MLGIRDTENTKDKGREGGAGNTPENCFVGEFNDIGRQNRDCVTKGSTSGR
jgi:hypothetical protein